MGLVTVKKAIKKRIHDFIWKMADLDEMDDRVRSTSYFVRNSIEATSLPKATGNARKMQMCDVQLLRVFDALCQKYQWTYWLDCGTLLGAVRHKGFIPWDDDMDIAVTRETYNDILNKKEEVIRELGLEIEERPGWPMSRIGFSYMHRKTGVWMDIFAIDECEMELSFDEGKGALFQKMNEYRELYKKLKNKKEPKELTELRETIISFPGNHTSKILYHGPEFEFTKNLAYDYNMVYPLEKIEFEGYLFNVPNRVADYLCQFYGPHFMQLPSGGVNVHSNGAPLSEWAAINGIDLDDIFTILKQMADDLQV